MMSMSEAAFEDPTESLEILMNTYFDKNKAMLLVRAKANPDTKDIDGKPLLHKLFEIGTHDEIRELILIWKGDINITDSKGKTALQYQLKNKNLSPGDINLFAELKADFNVTDENGDSVIVNLSLLNHQKFNDVVYQILIQHQAKAILSNDFTSIDTTKISFEKELGSGAFATVFFGRWNKEEVATKIFPVDEKNFARQLKNYSQEVKILSMLTNVPNIIGFKGHNISHYHIVFEYAEKGSLEDLIKSGLILSWDLRYEMAKEIIIGLDGMHKKDILHRDIKSGNILVTTDNHAKIADFGSATTKMIRYRDLVGTPAYQAPECMFGPFYSEKTDVYSFSRIVLEIIYWQNLNNLIPKNFLVSYKEIKTDVSKFNDKEYMKNFYDEVRNFSKLTLPKDCPNSFTLFAPCFEYSSSKRAHADEIVEKFECKLG